MGKLHIVMEFADGGELYTKVTQSGRLNEKDVRPLFAQVTYSVYEVLLKNWRLEYLRGRRRCKVPYLLSPYALGRLSMPRGPGPRQGARPPLSIPPISVHF